jgi:5-methylcytosine-specific restriction endonuclease McrA
VNRQQWASRPGRTSSWIARSTRFAIYHRDGFRCVYCRKQHAADGEGLTLDHIEARGHGGNHKPENLVTACLSCNSRRQHKKLRKPTLERLRRLAARPLNREVGRLLARISRVCRRDDIPHPLV